MAVQQKQGADAVGCRTLFSALLSLMVCDILQIPTGCIAPAHSAPPPAAASRPALITLFLAHFAAVLCRIIY
jgi:hypothetical protein